MRIATSSPRRIELCPDTGFFKQMGLSWYGMKMQEPAPQGPGLGWQEPSVNAMMDLGEQLSSRPWMIEHDSFCCSSVLDFDEPNRSQYSGRLFEGWSESSNENSGSMLKVVVPVSEDISSSWICILPNGDKNFSFSISSFQLSQDFWIRIWSPLLIILEPSLIDNSCLLVRTKQSGAVSKVLQIISIAQQSLSNIKLKKTNDFQCSGKKTKSDVITYITAARTTPQQCVFPAVVLAHPLEATRKEGKLRSTPTDIQTQRPHTENKKKTTMQNSQPFLP